MRAALLLLLFAAAFVHAGDIPLADGTDSSYPLFRRAAPLSENIEPPKDLILAADPSADSSGVPEEEVAAKAGLHWLTLVDEAKYGESYHFVAPFVRKRFEEMHWTDMIIRQRKPLGDVTERHVAFVQHRTNMEGGPPGRYMVLHYYTEFTEGKRLEMITLYRDASDNWRVAGYGISDMKS